MDSVNLLKSAIEYYDIKVKESDFQKAVNSIMFVLRNRVFDNKDRIILKMELISFVINNRETIVIGGKLFGFFAKETQKQEVDVKVGVEIKYIEDTK